MQQTQDRSLAGELRFPHSVGQQSLFTTTIEPVCHHYWAQILQLVKPMCCSEDWKQPNKYLGKKQQQLKKRVTFSLAKVGRCKLVASSNCGASLMKKVSLRKWSWYTGKKKKERERKTVLDFECLVFVLSEAQMCPCPSHRSVVFPKLLWVRFLSLIIEF